MKFFGFIAGFFRNAAPESSTRLSGIMAFFAGLGCAVTLIICSCIKTHDITVTDLAVLVIVLAFGCTALGLRSPVPPEVIAALAGVKIESKPVPDVRVETTTATEVKAG